MKKATYYGMGYDLLDKWGLPEWGLKISKEVTCCGRCNGINKIISLSIHYLKMNADELIINTLLHEIAHALTPGEGHGRKWKLKCLEIGCKPDRLNREAVMPRGKKQYVCSTCGKVSYRHRKPSRRMACGACCEKYNGGKFDARYLIELK